MGTEGCSDEYLFQGTQCRFTPPDEDDTHVILYKVSRLNCRRLCSTLYSDFCAGFYFDGQRSSCYIGPYTEKKATSDKANCSKTEMEFQRRWRCLGKVNIKSLMRIIELPFTALMVIVVYIIQCIYIYIYQYYNCLEVASGRYLNIKYLQNNYMYMSFNDK